MADIQISFVFILALTLHIQLAWSQTCQYTCSGGTADDIDSIMKNLKMGSKNGDNEAVKWKVSKPSITLYGNQPKGGGAESNELPGLIPSGTGKQPLPSFFGNKGDVQPKVEGAEKPGECTIVQQGVDEAGIKEILDLHNRMRYKVAQGKQSGLPQAGNMRQLHWDKELAEKAQELSNTCQFKHNEVSTAKYGKLGQNIFTSSSTAFGKPKPPYKTALSSWYGEVKLFPPSNIKPYKFGSSYGHFTQVVWADSSAVGCGYTAFKLKGSTIHTIIACDYGIAGNMRLGAMYKAGKPCTNCPETCSNTYKGLCDS